jgi:DNA (cytosine-5)-methyltransferase 1
MLAELGYGFAYRVLDAQYFGVAQRRRRVFVVGYLGDWHHAAAVVFERKSLSRDTPQIITEKPRIGRVFPCLTRRGLGCLREEEGLVVEEMGIRHLTPVECERLQGFPDNYTNIPWRKKPESPNGLRVSALGNSMAVPVMHWIGERIAAVEAL